MLRVIFRAMSLVCIPVTISNAQLPKASDYFPLQVGNVWQYQHHLGSSKPRQWEIVSDTLVGDTLRIYRALLKVVDESASPGGFLYYHYNCDSTVVYQDTEFPQVPFSGFPMIDTRNGIGVKWLYFCGDIDCAFAITDTGSAVFYTQTRRWADVYEVDAFQDTLKLLGKAFRFAVGIGPVRQGIDTLLYAKIDGVEFGVPVSVEDKPFNPPIIPEDIALRVYPNPVRENATIYLEGSLNQEIEIRVVDILGRTVRTLIRRQRGPGPYRISWDGKDQQGNPLANGIYFVSVKTGNLIKAHKVIYLR